MGTGTTENSRELESSLLGSREDGNRCCGNATGVEESRGIPTVIKTHFTVMLQFCTFGEKNDPSVTHFESSSSISYDIQRINSIHWMWSDICTNSVRMGSEEFLTRVVDWRWIWNLRGWVGMGTCVPMQLSNWLITPQQLCNLRCLSCRIFWR